MVHTCLSPFLASPASTSATLLQLLGTKWALKKLNPEAVLCALAITSPFWGKCRELSSKLSIIWQKKNSPSSLWHHLPKLLRWAPRLSLDWWSKVEWNGRERNFNEFYYLDLIKLNGVEWKKRKLISLNTDLSSHFSFPQIGGNGMECKLYVTFLHKITILSSHLLLKLYSTVLFY